ncbi:MAG TPA: hypothetical protein DDZ89_05420, partial [Clostridiales bacterium]|nr:hypothetical protein [Clostridiales bacterium]
MRKIIFSLLLILSMMFHTNVLGKPSSAGVADAVKQSVPKGFSIENTISKTDEVSINDIVIRYGLSLSGDKKLYYGYQCDIKSKEHVMTAEVTSFYLEQDAVAALEQFSDGYSKYLTGIAGLEQSRMKIQKADERIDKIPVKSLVYTMDNIPKRTIAFIKHNFLIVLSYPEQISKDAQSLIVLLDQNLENASVEDAQSTGRTYMEVIFSPSCFSEETDTVEITATIHYPDNYKGKKPLDTIKLSDTQTGKQIQSKPIGTGVGVFSIKHIDENIKLYEFTLTCGDFSKDISVPVLETQVELEQNTLTNVRYTGIVADGFQTMKIRVTLAGMNKGELEIHQPDTGKVVSFGILQRKKIRNPDEIVEFEYIPPKYIEGEMQKETFQGEDLYYITVPIAFTYTPDNGIPIELKTQINVYRPPVVLASAWDIPVNETDGLYGFLKKNEFTVFRYDELSKVHAMEIMNERFTSYMKDLADRMINSGIKVSRFDTVSFGLGGLITRYYINSSSYRNDIRKCILIAVPNHGLEVNTFDST